MELSIASIIFCSFIALSTAAHSNETCKTVQVSEQEISDTFFKDYGVWQRPVLNPETIIDVNITFVLSSINDVIEKEKALKLSGYIEISWFSEFHVWNYQFPYSCVPYIVLLAEDIWLPDIVQQNNRLSRYALMNMLGEKVRINSNGLTQYSPGGHIEATCKFDLSLFPFDIQRCALSLESWRYKNESVRFHLPKSNIVLRDFFENMQWHLEGTYHELNQLPSPDTNGFHDHVNFYMVISRKVTHYV